MFVSMAVVCALFSIALAVALSGMKATAEKFHTFIARDQAFLSASTNLYAQGVQMGQALRNIVLDPATEQAYKNLAEAGKQFDESVKTAQLLAKDDPQTLKTLASIGQMQDNLDKIQQHIVGLAKTDKDAAAAALRKEETPMWRQLRSEILDLIKVKNEAVLEAKTDLANKTREKLITSIVMAVIALVAGGIIAFWLTRNVMQQLGGEPDYAVNIATGIAAGDLTAKIDLDEKNQASLLYAMKSMQDSLVALVGKVRSGTETIATASSQIASGNQDLSSRTEEQASSLEETASSMEELTSTVKQNADNARQANQLAQVASDTALKGGQVVANVVDTMGSISDSASKIADIIGVIDGIAFQTNILALNAAVEAARAGEQGRGFAVVATEVRSLAQRSAAAAKEIKTLIEDSVEKVDAGSKLVNQAGATMDEVVSSVARVTDIMAEITAASQEQSAGIEQVNQAIGQMDQVTQQNAALVEEAAAAAEAMQDQAAQLNVVVSTFKVKPAERTAQQPTAGSTVQKQAGTRAAFPGNAAQAARQVAQRAPSRPQLKHSPAAENSDWEEF